MALTWWRVWQDDLRYGRPRTYQTDALVSSTDTTEHPSHFIVLNLQGRAVIYYLPGGDLSKTKAYAGMTLVGEQTALSPVTIDIRDVTGDHHPDLIVKADGVIEGVFVNDGKGGFRISTPADHLTVGGA